MNEKDIGTKWTMYGTERMNFIAVIFFLLCFINFGNTNDVISTIAGAGTGLNDGGAATSALLCGPFGIALDSASKYINSNYPLNNINFLLPR